MTQRTISKVLIAQEDLALGQGSVNQTRQGLTVPVTKMDLPWVFTTILELRQLDTTLYKHCILDSAEQVLFYRYTADSAETVDDYLYIAPNVGSGQWKLVSQLRKREYDYDSVADFLLSSPDSYTVNIIGYSDTYKTGTDAQKLAGPKGGHKRHRTGETVATTSVPNPANSTEGTAANGNAGYSWTADGVEWFISIDYAINVLSLGAVGGQAALDTQAFLGAISIGVPVYIPFSASPYIITEQLSPVAGCSKIFGDGKYYSVCSKQFNGDLFLINGSGAELTNFGIEGNGATYTGGGLHPRGYNINLSRLRINDTQDSCIIVDAAVGTNATAATYLNVSECFLNPTNSATTYAVRSDGADDSTRPTCREFSNISGGSSLIDFSGMNFAILENSLGTSVKFGTESSKIHMNDNRITSTENIVIYGRDHVIGANSWGFSSGKNVSIDATATNVFFSELNNIVINSSSMSSIDQSISDGDPNPNNISTQLKAFNFGWFADSSNPTLGNSTTYAYYKQSGRFCWATFGLVRGSTANVGSGVYTFQLPFKSYVDSTGIARIKSSSGTHYSATVNVVGGSGVCTMWIDAASSQFGSASITFSTGATINCTICYLISPT